MKYYYLVTWYGVEPQLFGPFNTAELRDEDAKKWWKEDGIETGNGVFKVESSRNVYVGSYTDAEFEDDV